MFLTPTDLLIAALATKQSQFHSKNMGRGWGFNCRVSENWSGRVHFEVTRLNDECSQNLVSNPVNRSNNYYYTPTLVVHQIAFEFGSTCSTSNKIDYFIALAAFCNESTTDWDHQCSDWP